MSSDGLPRLFDKNAIQRYRRRARNISPPVDFLVRHAVEDMADRLASIRRPFARVLAQAVAGPHLPAMLAKRETTQSLLATTAWPIALRQGSCPPVPWSIVRAEDDSFPFAAGAFDLVCSALTWHAIDDLPGLLLQARMCLAPDGLLLATLLGGHTLHELRDALLTAETELRGTACPRVHPFAEIRDLGALLQRAGFALPVVDVDPLVVTYPTPLHLMHELRSMGAGNALVERRRVGLRRDVLTRALQIYVERYSTTEGRIRATFEIMTLTAWSVHESQQQPLRPGDGRTRLSDVLGRK